MKLTSLGYIFRYHGDEITRYWPWKKAASNSVYYSALLSRDFNSFPEYWMAVGEDTAMIKLSTGVGRMYGFDLKDIVGNWSARIWLNEYIVFLNIHDPAEKGPDFWSRLSTKQCESLQKDCVILKCNDRSEMVTLVDSVDYNFAEATGYLNGEVLLTNESHYD